MLKVLNEKHEAETIKIMRAESNITSFEGVTLTS